MSDQTFADAVRLLDSRINLEQLRELDPHLLEGRLDFCRNILEQLGKPETKYPIVHVTGTKGKGSVCAFLESIFLSEGKRVGKFTSPHLYNVTERITLNNIPISENAFTELLFGLNEKIAPKDFSDLTYFELLTIAAFIFFEQQGVDIAIFEVGLGGRLDSTNVCQPDVSVISSVSFDHIMQLGPTLSDIATEKAGIIKQGVPIVSAVLHPDAQAVLRAKAKKKNAPLFFLGESFFVRRTLLPAAPPYTFHFQTFLPEFPADYEIDDVTLSMPGAHQVRNAALALAARLLLEKRFGVPNPAIVKEALKEAFIPLRVEIVRKTNETPTLIFDAAHNRSSIRVFIRTVASLYPRNRLLLIFGVSLGKDVEGMLAELGGRFHRIYLTRYSEGERAFPLQALKTMFLLNPDQIPFEEEEDDTDNFVALSVSLNPVIADAVLTCPLDFDAENPNLEIIEDCTLALERCLQFAAPDDVICVTGSFFLAAELRRYYQEKESL